MNVLSHFARALILAGGLTAVPETLAADNGRDDLIAAVVDVSERLLANPAWIESQEWQDFIAHVSASEMSNLDDEAFRLEFNRAAERLPFTHFWLQRPVPDGLAASDILALSEVGEGTALLRVDSFSIEETAMLAMIDQVEDGEYRRLIIDLRQNPGGSFPAAAALGRYLTRDSIDTGVYLTRRWFVEHASYPDPEQIAGIAALEELDLDLFRQRLVETGAVRLVLPGHDGVVFDGDVYVLTSRETASAAEPFVDLIRRRPGVR